MKIALLSDIHGNATALEAVLAEARRRGVERLFVCGDFIGYYYDVSGVFDLLDPWPFDACQGNHDLSWHFPEKVRGKYGSGAAVARDRLSLEQKEWLEALPHPNDLEIAGKRVRLCHGTPWDRDEYLYPDAPEEMKRRAAEGPFDLVVFGHTHYPWRARIDGTWLVNPGSVGQQRHGVPGAHWALWDTGLDEVEPQVSSYDADAVKVEALQRDPELPYLANVLDRCREEA